LGTEPIEGIPSTHGAERLVVVLTFVAVLALVIFPVSNFDLFWHISNGRAMLEEGRIINEEIFSYTAAGKKFHNHEWLSQIMLHLIHDRAGASGLIALKTLVAMAVAMLLYRTARMAGADRLSACMLLGLVFLSSYKRYMVRPQLFSFLFISLLGYLLFGVRAGRLNPRWLLSVPAIMVLWDLMHGAIYGVVFLSAFVFGETAKKYLPAGLGGRPADTRFLRRLWWTAGLSALFMLLSPYGFRSYGTFLEYTGSNVVVTSNLEFQRTPLMEFGLFWFLLAFALALSLVFVRKLDLTHVCLLLPFAVLAVRYNRATAAFALVVLPVLGYYMSLIALELRGPSERRWLRWYNCTVLSGVAVAVLALKIFTADYAYALGLGMYEKHYPAGAVRFVETAQVGGNMYNPGHIGGYLAYRLYPERKIFQYNHANTFGAVMNETTDEAFINKYEINYAFIPHFPEGYKEDFFSGPEWVPVYRDRSATVVLRNTPGNRFIIDQQ
jgi:hypothetical protein